MTSRIGKGSRLVQNVLLLAVGMALAAGGVLYLFEAAGAARALWAGATAAVLMPTLIAAGARLLHRDIGVDLIAVLAMAGALALGEYLAGAIIALMSTGGAALERFAVARARRELTALLERAPRMAHRVSDGALSDVDVDEVAVGDRLLVKPGEVVPADGVVASDSALLDEASLTGETKPVRIVQGMPVRSGGTNSGAPFELLVAAPPAQSTYAGIVRLVAAAETSKAPFVRLADRYALAFLAITLLLAAGAWAATGDPIRALAVLVVATPCPLILAAPAAIIAGVSRAARHGIIIKGGGPLETLARVEVLLLDKTGTVTAARPRVTAVETFDVLPSDDLVRLAASAEQASGHPYAPAIIAEARLRNLPLSFPQSSRERMGTGLTGLVDGREVAVGRRGYVAPKAEVTPEIRSLELRTTLEGSSSVFVAVDGVLAGALVLQDPIRAEAPRVLRELRKAGVRRIHMVTGDHADTAELVGDVLGVDRVYAERSPEDKVEIVRQVRTEGITAMIGDGINDAPALTLADVGIAMGARGATAASQAADIVLTTDRLEGLSLASRIAHRTRRIAVQSVAVGMGLSVAAMMLAAAGYISPVFGAVLQEGIDVLVILNALRALGGGRLTVQRRPKQQALGQRLALAHETLRPHVDELAALASQLDALPPADALARLVAVRTMLENELLPHEREEQETAYPILARLLEHEDPIGTLVQTHNEIRRLARLYSRLVERLPRQGPAPEDLRDLRRTLYGLHAILSLHFAQEEDLYSILGS